jgi:hypothetical protein
LKSDVVWYRANKVAGIAMLLAGAFWLGLGLVLPRLITPYEEAVRLAQMSGVGSLAIAVLVAFWLVYRRPSVGGPEPR